MRFILKAMGKLKQTTKKKALSILGDALLAYIVTMLVALVYKYGNYNPEYLVFPIIFLLIMILLRGGKN